MIPNFYLVHFPFRVINNVYLSQTSRTSRRYLTKHPKEGSSMVYRTHEPHSCNSPDKCWRYEQYIYLSHPSRTSRRFIVLHPKNDRACMNKLIILSMFHASTWRILRTYASFAYSCIQKPFARKIKLLTPQRRIRTIHVFWIFGRRIHQKGERKSALPNP